MNLHPECCPLKTDFMQRFITFVSLHNYQELIKAPWFAVENSVHILLVFKREQNFMVTKLLDLEAIPYSPQWCECSSYDLRVDSFSFQKFRSN